MDVEATAPTAIEVSHHLGWGHEDRCYHHGLDGLESTREWLIWGAACHLIHPVPERKTFHAESCCSHSLATCRMYLPIAGLHPPWILWSPKLTTPNPNPNPNPKLKRKSRDLDIHAALGAFYQILPHILSIHPGRRSLSWVFDWQRNSNSSQYQSVNACNTAESRYLVIKNNNMQYVMETSYLHTHTPPLSVSEDDVPSHQIQIAYPDRHEIFKAQTLLSSSFV